jgi:hypothetical protein
MLCFSGAIFGNRWGVGWQAWHASELSDRFNGRDFRNCCNQPHIFKLEARVALSIRISIIYRYKMIMCYFGDNLSLVAEVAYSTAKHGAKWLTHELIDGRIIRCRETNIDHGATVMRGEFPLFSRSP